MKTAHIKAITGTVLVSVLFLLVQTAVIAQDGHTLGQVDILTLELPTTKIAHDESTKTHKVVLPGSEVGHVQGIATTSKQSTLVTESWNQETDNRITNVQFSNTTYRVSNATHVENRYDPDNNSVDLTRVGETGQSLYDLIPTEEEIDATTKMTKWRFVTIEQNFDKTENVTDSIHVLMKDIRRVYDPVFNKYKIPTMSIQIVQLASQSNVNGYWLSNTNMTKQEIFDAAYMTGKTSNGTECFFKYSEIGAVTACMQDSMVIQVIIYDEYGEHYQYNESDIHLDETEPTTSIMNEIIRKIGTITKIKDADIIKDLHFILHRNHLPDNMQDRDPPPPNMKVENEPPENTTVTDEISKNVTDNKQKYIQKQPIDPENSITHGIESLSCIRDDFGLVTIAGRYNNNNASKEQVNIKILFIDWHDKTIGSTNISFTNLVEFESRKFLGHVKWNENFATCQYSTIIN